MDTEALKWWLSLASERGVGPVTFKKMVDILTPEEIYSLPPKGLGEQFPFLRGDTRQLISLGPKLRQVEEELSKAHSLGVKIITWDDVDFPESLKVLRDAPPVLYVKGEIPKMPMIGVVGTRNFTPYGKSATEQLVMGLASMGYGVSSGLARGIDTIAHRACLASHSPTVAVLGTGIDVPYPASNRDLFEKIVETGAVLTEFPLGTLPEPKNFPRRNRLISGISKGVLLTEAGEKSGALFTCEYARLQGKPIFAVPGSIYNTKSNGTNRMIQKGAHTVSTWQDIALALGEKPGYYSAPKRPLLQRPTGMRTSSPTKNKPPFFPSRLKHEEQKVFQQLESEKSIDELCELCSSVPHRILPILLNLEVAGLVSRGPGSLFHQKL